MPIYRTTLTSNFTQISNDLLASPLPPVPSKVLNYLLSKPSNWQMQRTDLKKTLALTGYAIQKALKWLQLNGYAWFTRFCGKTTWRFTDNPNSVSTKPINQVTPTSPVIAESIEIQHVENQHVLTIIEKQTNNQILRIPIGNYENHENHKIPFENYENYENLRIPYENHENHGNHKIHIEKT